jgi:hypothetical protein
MIKNNQEQEKTLKTYQSVIENLKKSLEEKQKQASDLKFSFEDKIKSLEDVIKYLNKEKTDDLIKFDNLQIEHSNCIAKISFMEGMSKSLIEKENLNNHDHNKKIKLLEESNEKLRLLSQEKEYIINELNSQLLNITKQFEENNKINGEQFRTNFEIVEKFEKEIQQINLRNSSLEKENKNYKVSLLELLNKLENIKNTSINTYENMNLRFLEFDKTYTMKINTYKQKIENFQQHLNKIRTKTKMKVSKNNNLEIKSSINFTLFKTSTNSTKRVEELNYKLIIEKFKKEKNELKLRSDEFEKTAEILKKEKNLLLNTIDKIEKSANNSLLSENKIWKSKFEWLEKEYNKFLSETEPELKRSIEDLKNKNSILLIKNKDLEYIVSQFKIENDGKSKIINELTDEINSLKTNINKL